MATNLHIAQQLYEQNCAAHDGKDHDGFPLPTWAELMADERKHPVVDMWVRAAMQSTVKTRQPVKVNAGGWE